MEGDLIASEPFIQGRYEKLTRIVDGIEDMKYAKHFPLYLY